MVKLNRLLALPIFFMALMSLALFLAQKNVSEKKEKAVMTRTTNREKRVAPVITSTQTPSTVVLSQQAINDLVNRAAQQKYLQDVFNSDAKLTTAKPLPLQPINTHTEKPSSTVANVANSNPQNQRCLYKGQSYVAGDIVKTEQGWIRCTPTLIFSPDNPTQKEYGSPAWTVVQ